VAIRIDVLHPVTDEELRALSERNPGYQFERTAEGRLVVAPVGTEGGARSGEVFGQLRDWNRGARLGLVFDASTGFNLPNGACRSPDAAWVAQARWDALSLAQRQGFAPLCPDAVFEVRSRSDTLAELRAKMREYMDNGARLGVLIDCEGGAVEVYRPGADPERHGDVAAVALDPELPGFVLDLRAILIL
jgi:Uma2 family endonuclease